MSDIVSKSHRKIKQERHGECIGGKTRLYKLWINMVKRCCNPNHGQYKNYGGRGISVCDEWKSSFSSFREYAFSQGYADHLEIDREDNDGNYEPGNVRFVSSIVNANNKRTTHWLMAFGERKSIADWARDPRCKVGYSALKARSNRGWNHEIAITSVRNTTMPKGDRAYNKRFAEAFGECKTISDWSRDPRCVVGYWTLHSRIYKRGWSPECAITKPPKK